MLGAAHTKAKMVVRSGSERFAAVRIFAFFLGMAGFIALTSVAAGRAARGDGEAFRSPMARSINAPITASGATMPGATIATGQGRADHCPRAGEAASYVEGDFRSRRLCGRRFLAPQFPDSTPCRICPSIGEAMHVCLACVTGQRRACLEAYRLLFLMDGRACPRTWAMTQ